MQDEELTDQIIKAYFTVYNTLGFGFMEKVYENALAMELLMIGLSVRQQERINVFYKNNVVGEYWADIQVNEKVILELKAAEKLRDEHRCQLVNYLRATTCEIGLLLNFGRVPEIRRVLYQNVYKKAYSFRR
jgi:GxxExxY protein